MSIVNIECYRGDSAEWSLNVAKDELPVDLTGAKIWMTARRNMGGTQVFQRTELAGITIDPDQVTNRGDAIIKLSPTSTSSLPSEVVVLQYDIQVKTAAGDLWTVNSGTLTVSPDVTIEVA